MESLDQQTKYLYDRIKRDQEEIAKLKRIYDERKKVYDIVGVDPGSRESIWWVVGIDENIYDTDRLKELILTYPPTRTTEFKSNKETFGEGPFNVMLRRNDTYSFTPVLGREEKDYFSISYYSGTREVRIHILTSATPFLKDMVKASTRPLTPSEKNAYPHNVRPPNSKYCPKFSDITYSKNEGNAVYLGSGTSLVTCPKEANAIVNGLCGANVCPDL